MTGKRKLALSSYECSPRIRKSRRLSQLLHSIVSNTTSLPANLNNGDCSKRDLNVSIYEFGETSGVRETAYSEYSNSTYSGKPHLNISTDEFGKSSCVRGSSIIDSVTSDSETLPEYFDIGDCEYICKYCSAIFWFGERVVSASTSSAPKYNRCCKAGAVSLPFPLRPPPTIKHLFSDSDFMENIRAYNNMFSMTSFGAQIDDTINDGRGPYVFKISGQVSHWIGSMCPANNDSPRFLQLYIYDTTNEITNRLRFFGNANRRKLSEDVVRCLSDTLNSCNEYARLFKNAAEMCAASFDCEFSIRLYNNTGDRRYEPPAPGTLGGIVYANDSNASKYDIVIHNKNGTPQRISKLHPSYMPLQYPLLFPFAEQGWSPDLRLRPNSDNQAKRLTVNMYYSYQIHDRESVYSLVLNGGRLFQQYVVDAYTCIEENRLDYINANQNLFRSEHVAGLNDAFEKGDNNVENIGKRVFLPSSFTGGPRYMYKHYQDALAICQVYGNPQYFVTFTCNVKWPEITRHLQRLGGLHAEDRPDIISRVFHIKVLELLKFIKSDKTFGDVAADLYTIEFQKRGLPHCHTLIWVTSTSKIHDAVEVDNYISAEIPDPSLQPLLHKVVTEYMIHGPCGLLRPDSPCMRGNKCSKLFPKAFQSTTVFDKDGYAHYKRRKNNGHLKNGIKIDNGYVVPYNKRLCARFHAHINVEYCGWNMMIKYLFKYISKGADRVRFHITKFEETSDTSSTITSAPVNEIKNFLDGRYICPHEAAWRILDFPIHERNPSVQILAVHLEDMQNVTFRQNSALEAIIRKPSFGKTTLTEWLRNNNRDSNGWPFTYLEYPTKYRWDKLDMTWLPRLREHSFAIGRLAYVHPASGEPFYLRMLLTHQRGCKSFADIRTVSNVPHTTYQAACEALGLLGDDKEWLTAFIEASSWATSSELRALFTHMLLFCDVSQPIAFLESQWKRMADDIRLRLNSELTNENCFINDNYLHQYVLLELETLLTSATPSKSLADFGLPLPSTTLLFCLRNRLLMEETCYDRAALDAQHSHFYSMLNSDQLKVYNPVLTSYQIDSQLLLFVYGHGGTGKTFLWTTIISYFRSIGKIVLAVAASGISSLLLPSGRTAHSRFKIPVELTDQSTCHIKKNTQLADLLRQTVLIIWDEAPMSDRRCFECLDRTLRDITDNEEQPFGGKSILLGGDFRQTLPVKPKGTNFEIINSTLPRSYLWQHFQMLKLNENMRLKASNEDTKHREDASKFASWLLNIGDGLLGQPDKNDPYNTRLIEIPTEYLIPYEKNSLQSLIRFIYDEAILNNPSALDLSTRAIVCPTNDTTDEINKLVLTMTPGECKTYTSHDAMIPHSDNYSDIDALYPMECLNQLNFPGIPPHQLSLKVNTPVILIRNINITLGVCNGTRLIVTQLLPRIIEAEIITGTSTGNRVYIPRIKFVHNNKGLPFAFTRRQFPIKVCYAMTINKSQGQSLKRIGVYLPKPVFTHVQLYVAFSRATSPSSLKVLIEPTEDIPKNTTKNVVFSEFMAEINNLAKRFEN